MTLTRFPNGISAPGLTSTIRRQATLSPAQVAANTTAEQTFAVSGVAATDVVISVNKPTAQAGLGIVGWRVASAGNVGITFANNTATPITPTASQVYQILTMSP